MVMVRTPVFCGPVVGCVVLPQAEEAIDMDGHEALRKVELEKEELVIEVQQLRQEVSRLQKRQAGSFDVQDPHT